MRPPRPVLAVALTLLTSLVLAASARAADPLASLKASCTTKSAGTGLSYRFCDDGVPDQGGRVPNTSGAKAVLVPASYAGAQGLPAPKPDAACGTPAAAVPGSAPDPSSPTRCDVALDVDISTPTGPPPPGGRPLLVLMHGCCSGNKTSWEASSVDATGEKWHYSNAWFASRGYVVVTYTARGFVSNQNKGSTGETQIDSLPYEMNDFQQLAGYLADDPSFHVDPSRVVATGGSYGGGFSWLALTDPFWTSPRGKSMQLAAVGAKYGWTDLAYSLVPTGDHLEEPGRMPAVDGSDTGVGSAPAGIPKASILTALYGSGQAAVTDHATFPSTITQVFSCLQASWPPESNPLCAGPTESVLADFVKNRSAYYQDGTHGAVDFFGRLRTNPAYRIPVYDAATFTDPLFTDVENRRMVNRLNAASPDYPVQQYYGDYNHFVQNKDRTWGDECGADHHVCTRADYPGGDLNATPATLVRTGATTRLNRFLDHYAAPPGDTGQPVPAHDVTAELQRCDGTEEPGEQFTAPTFEGLTKGGLSLAFTGTQTTTSPSADSHGLSADPVGNLAANGGSCPKASSKAAPSVATYESPVLPSPATMLGPGEVRATYRATGGPGFQLNARLYDVAPDGSALMVDRGPTRLTAASGTTSYELHGNGWRFEKGHRVRLELTADDSPYLRAPSSPTSIAVSAARITLPVRETTFGTAKPGSGSGGGGAGGDRTAPRAAIRAPLIAASGSATRRVPLRWSGSDVGSGVAAFRVQARRARTKAWRTIRVSKGTGYRWATRAGTTYALRVRARDRAGNLGRWSRESVMTVPRDERMPGIRLHGPWSRPKLPGSWNGRAYRCASTRCRLRFRYTGGTLSLVAPVSPRSGRIVVRIDRTTRIVRLAADRYRARQIVVRIPRSRKAHRVYIRVVSGRAAIDAYGLR